MAKYSPNAIPNKHADWGIDTTDLQQRPFSGGAVQSFLKQMLESKSGYFYKDIENNRILIFADEENKDAYIQDPVTNASLLIESFPLYEKVNSISDQSTHNQYPSAKCVYDLIGNVESILELI